MSWKDIKQGKNFPEVITVVIEIPKGSRNKYEYDEELDVIKLDRVNPDGAMSHPYDYGDVPGTRSGDGDHLDAFVLLDNSVFPGCVVQARPLAVLKMIDSGEYDEKLLCVPADDAHYKHITSMDQLSPQIFKEIAHFFEHYKDLKGEKVEVQGWGDRDEALEIAKKAYETYMAEGHE